MLALELLEPRAVPTAAPFVASLPESNAGLPAQPIIANTNGPALIESPEGEPVAADGADAGATPLHVELQLPDGIDIYATAQLPDGTLRLSQGRNPTVTDLTTEGELLRTISLGLPPGENNGDLVAVSASGRWLAGSQGYVSYYSHADPATWPHYVLWDAENPDSFVAIDLNSVPGGGLAFIRDISDSGVVLINPNGGLGYRWDAQRGLVRLVSSQELAPETGETARYAYGAAISADGSVIVGHSGGWGTYPEATLWTDAEHPQLLPDLGGHSDALTVSLDGRVIGGVVHDPTQNANSGGLQQAAVWVDGELAVLKDAKGQPIPGQVEHVVNGLDGDPRKWVAIGSTYGQSFSAFSNAPAWFLNDWLWDEYSVNLTGQQHVRGAFVRDNELSILAVDWRIDLGAPGVVGEPVIPLPPLAAHLIVVPLDRTRAAIPFDLDRDGAVAPSDALHIINLINFLISAGIDSGAIPPGPHYTRLDLTADGFLTAADALEIINRLNASTSSSSIGTSSVEGEPLADDSLQEIDSLTALDAIFSELGAPRRSRLLG